MKIAAIAWGLLAFAGVSLVSSQSQSQSPHPFQPAGTYVHQGTGFAFPLTVGDFQRIDIIEYNADGSDMSAGYNIRQPGRQVVVTVYVYPAPPVSADDVAQSSLKIVQDGLCANHWEQLKHSILSKHPTAALVEEGPTPSPSPNFGGLGKRVVYHFDETFAGQVQPLQSEADLYCFFGGKWLIAYRTTAPVTVAYQKELDALMHMLAWPAPQ